mgnify:FL=1
MPNPENIESYKFPPGTSGNPNGRPKKYVSTLKNEGYKLSEVNDTIQTMMSMSYEEIREVYNDKGSTVLEKTIASAIKKCIEKGSMESIETLLNRVYGRPKEKVHFEGGVSQNIKVEIVPPISE